VFCHEWSYACWSWWSTESYSACFGTGDSSVGLV